MAVYSNADTVVCWGYWRDEVTWAGVKAGDQPATVTFDPVPLAGSDTPNLRDITARGWLKTRQRVARVDPTTGYFAALLVASNDPDLDAYGGRRVTFSGETPFTVEVPWNTATVSADAAMVAALKGSIPGLAVGTSVKAVPLIDLALTSPSPTPPSSYLTTTQTLSALATAVDVHDTDPDAHADIRALASQGGVSDATASSKGVTRLLGGTADAPTVPWSKVTGAPTSYPPSGGAGGVLSGTFPNPGFAVDMATQAELDAAVAAVPEQARDAIGAALVAGANVGISVNDAADTITITATVPAGYSDEQAQDAAAALIAAGTHSGISFAYNDAGNALTATVAFPVSSVNGRTGAVSGLAEQSALSAHTGDTANPHAVTKAQVGLGNVTNVAPADLPVSTATAAAISSASTADRDRANHTGNQPASSISDLPEAVQDIVGGFIVAGDNVTVTYNDAANTFRIDAVGGGGGGGTTDQEVVRDTIGAALVAGANIQITVDDPGNTITVAVTGLATVATTGSYADLSNKPVTGVSSVNTRSGAVTGLAEAADLTAHTSRTDNPHSTTKAQVGLGNVDNTSDAAKPVSTAQQSALDAKTPTTRQVTAGTGLSGGGDLTADRSFAVSYGTTAGTAAQGNDARLSDQRTPTDGSVTNPKVATNAAIDESKLALASDAVAATASRRTLGTGAQQAAAGNHNHDATYAATSHTHTGYAATSHTHGVTDLTATGTRDATTFLRGDNTWAAIAAADYNPVSRTFAQGAYTASPNDYVLADASGGAFTVTLPSTGIAGVKKTDTTTNIVTVAASSGKTIGTLGAASIAIRLPDQAMVTQVNGTNHVITEGYHSLTSLDARYPAAATVPAADRTVTANTTAVAGETLRVNATSGAVTVTPPASPAVGSRVFLTKTDSSANTVTWSGTVSGDTGGVVLSAAGAGATLGYTAGGWILQSTTTAATGRTGGGSAPTSAGARNGTYDPRTNSYFPTGGALRAIRGHLMRAALPASAQLVDMVCLGDSRVAGSNITGGTGADAWPSAIRARLAAAGLPSAGTGLVMASTANTLDARIALSGSWSAQYPYRGWSASGATATFTSDFATTAGAGVVEVYYYGNSGGFTVKIGAGSAQPVTTPGTTTVQKATYTGQTIAVGTTITVTSTSTSGALIGFCVRNTSGLLVHQVGYGGTTSTQLATTGAVTLQGITSAISPSILGVMIGTNDPPSSVTAGSLASNLTAICQTNNPNAAKYLLVETPYDTQQGAWPAYVSATYDQADALGAPLLDINDRYVTPALGNAAGLLGSDLLHETVAGSQDLARAVTNLLTA